MLVALSTAYGGLVRFGRPDERGLLLLSCHASEMRCARNQAALCDTEIGAKLHAGQAPDVGGHQVDGYRLHAVAELQAVQHRAMFRRESYVQSLHPVRHRPVRGTTHPVRPATGKAHNHIRPARASERRFACGGIRENLQQFDGADPLPVTSSRWLALPGCHASKLATPMTPPDLQHPRSEAFPGTLVYQPLRLQTRKSRNTSLGCSDGWSLRCGV